MHLSRPYMGIVATKFERIEVKAVLDDQKVGDLARRLDAAM